MSTENAPASPGPAFSTYIAPVASSPCVTVAGTLKDLTNKSGLGASVGVGVGVGVGVAVGVAVGEFDGLGSWLLRGFDVGGTVCGAGVMSVGDDSLGAAPGVTGADVALSTDGAAVCGAAALGDTDRPGAVVPGTSTDVQAAQARATKLTRMPMRLMGMTSGREQLLVWVAAGPRRWRTLAWH